jgi:iron complex transport system substrate-binding protein
MSIKKNLLMVGLSAMACLGLAACNSTETQTKSESIAKADESKKSENKTQTITYLDKKYTIPSEVKEVATASLESMEDAAVLGVKPVGAITIAGELPDYLADDLAGAKSIGEKTQPNYETLLELKPDVILWTSKAKENVTEQLTKVAPTFPYSHISTNWEDNLNLMAQLTGKETEAEKIISDYKKDAGSAKEQLSESMKGKKVMVLRIRGGNVYVYPQDVYFNPVLYSDLGLEVPEVVKAAKAQEVISLEKLAEVNPDYVFLQFEESENADKPKALEELEGNPIWQSMNAAKNDKVFVNTVDPLAQGGTAWSKTAFLKAATDSLTE